jgi:hypothetical protein
VDDVVPGDSVQVPAVGVNEPLPFDAKLTLPVGALAVPASVSVTVTKHVVVSDSATVVGEQLTAVAVKRVPTVSDVEPELAVSIVLPP